MDTNAWLDQHDADITRKIREHRWMVQYVGGTICSRPGCECGEVDDPAFAYTTGLFGLGHPELLILGLDPGTAHGVLDDLAGRVRDGAQLLPGIPLTFEEWPHRIVPEPVPNPGDILFEANRFYQRPPEHSVPALQLSYDDIYGRFPWEDGYMAPHLQPRPGMFSAF